MQINLSLCRMALASAPADTIRFGTRGRRDDDVIDGQVREYAGGRLRTVSTETNRRTLPITIIQITWAEVETLRGWRGREVIFRDIHGRLIYGTFFGVSIKDWRGGTYDVTLTLQQISYEEAV